MTLQPAAFPFWRVGAPNRQGIPLLGNLSSTLLDGVNESVLFVGSVHWQDGGTHTVDTTGASKIEWCSGSVTNVNVGTTLKVGLAAYDNAAGPPTRGVNSSDVITMDVSKSHTGGGGTITTNAWQQNTPDAGSLAIPSGTNVALCFQMTARGGADLVNVRTLGTLASGAQSLKPGVTGYTGGVYANVSTVPNAILVASDGTLGYWVGGAVVTNNTSLQTWNNTSGTKEYGNVLQFPFPTRAYGFYCYPTITGDCDFVLYSDPLGTPVARATRSIDSNAVQLATAGEIFDSFPTPYDIPANTPVGIIAKPTTASNVSLPYLILNSSAHQFAWGSGYAINRNTGAFAAQNSSKDRYSIGLLLGAFSDGIGSGGFPSLGVI